MKGDRILIDTSVWIEYFKNQDKQFTGKVDQLLTFSNACVPKVVIAELLRGAKSEKEISVIEEFVEAFNILDQSDDTWIKAGRLSFSMKRRGVTVDIIDCYILLAVGREFKMIEMKEEIDIDLHVLPVHFSFQMV